MQLNPAVELNWMLWMLFTIALAHFSSRRQMISKASQRKQNYESNDVSMIVSVITLHVSFPFLDIWPPVLMANLEPLQLWAVPVPLGRLSGCPMGRQLLFSWGCRAWPLPELQPPVHGSCVPEQHGLPPGLHCFHAGGGETRIVWWGPSLPTPVWIPCGISQEAAELRCTLTGVKQCLKMLAVHVCLPQCDTVRNVITLYVVTLQLHLPTGSHSKITFPYSRMEWIANVGTCSRWSSGWMINHITDCCHPLGQ